MSTSQRFNLVVMMLASASVGFGIAQVADYNVVAAPVKAKALSMKAAVGGGTYNNVPCNITPNDIRINSDGSTVVSVDREMNGGHLPRQTQISADGTVFAVDGVAVTTPPPALQALGNVTSQIQAKLTAAYSAPGLAALICAAPQ